MWWRKPKVTVASVQNQLQSTLPIGSDATQVEQALEMLGAEYSFSEDKQVYLAILRNVRRGLITHESIRMELKMSSESGLQHILVQSVLTGP